MKTRTIKTILRKKIDGWLATIDDEAVRNLAADNVIVTGGAIASMLLREKVNDFDVYFRSYQALFAVAKYYVGRFERKNQTGIPTDIFLADSDGTPLTDNTVPADGRLKIIVKSAGVASEKGTDKPYQYFEAEAPDSAGAYVADVFDQEPDGTVEKVEEIANAINSDAKPSYRPVFLSTNAITLSQGVQLVLRFWGEPDVIHQNYDFAHCTNYWTSWDGNLELRTDALTALLTKELRYIGSRYPVCSVIRLRKFIGRGYTINAGQIVKIAMQISDLNLHDPKVLEDQLTGVDVAYMGQLLRAIESADPEKLTTAYIIELIDRMF